MILLAGCGNKQAEYAEVVNTDIADSFPLAAEPVAENPQLAESDGPYAILHTTAGDITIVLYPEQAPKAVENFIGLAKSGYYDGTLFHYVKRDEFVQTGKPGGRQTEAAATEVSATEAATVAIATDAEAAETIQPEETSIWDYPFEDEFDEGLHNFYGAVGMAGDGYNKNLSQFYLLVSTDKETNEAVIPANLYMNELVRLRTDELNELGRDHVLSETEIKEFETNLNAEIQAIQTDGIPAEYAAKYEPVIERYNTFGGIWNLDYQYTVFGQIVEGLNVAEAISQVKVDASNRKPKKDVVIESIEIVE